jgi:AraC-like DNA-binding protein
MKPILEKISPSQESSFALREFKQPSFKYPWHSHSEYELNYIKTGRGKRYVGSSIADFEEGDLVFIGPELPHCWLSEQKGHSLVAQFDEKLFGIDFINNPEMKSIRDLFRKSQQGIKFNGEICLSIRKSLEKMHSQPSFERLMEFLKTLNKLSHWKDITLLSSKGFGGLATDVASDKERLSRINTFIQANFKKQILLENVAGHISMTPSAFCKFFKARAQKTFVTYLNEFRIGYACRLLKETDIPITQIAFESGFENIANFYRQFKKVTGYSPKIYQDL